MEDNRKCRPAAARGARHSAAGRAGQRDDVVPGGHADQLDAGDKSGAGHAVDLLIAAQRYSRYFGPPPPCELGAPLLPPTPESLTLARAAMIAPASRNVRGLDSLRSRTVATEYFGSTTDSPFQY